MVLIDLGDLKMARETLCAAEFALGVMAPSRPSEQRDRARADMARIGRMIDQIDLLRPLGPDGKHGKLHTIWCGCDLPVKCAVCNKDGDDLCLGIDGEVRSQPHVARVEANR